MAPRSCSIPGCDRLTGIRGTARGYCSGHYQRWKKWGDPLVDGTRKKQRCTVADCDGWVYGHGLCQKHYYRMKRRGSVDLPPHPQEGVPDGYKRCGRCKNVRTRERFSPNRETADGLQAVCKECYAEARRRWVKEHPEREREYRRRAHVRAKAAERAKRHRKANPHIMRETVQQRRARMAQVAYEPVSAARVFERDGWKCQLCGRPIDPSTRYPDPMSASLDHIIPLSLKGPHLYTNVQAAHLRCNIRKHTGGNDQLRLIG